MIYHNPNDPALLVEKRMGIGWTFNFANKWVVGSAWDTVSRSIPNFVAA
jgi:uncharacterized membrane protein